MYVIFDFPINSVFATEFAKCYVMCVMLGEKKQEKARNEESEEWNSF